MINSIWADSAPLSGFPSLNHDLKTDVLIIGGGMAGILCAHKLSRSGVDYALIEADQIFGGITRNTTAKLTSQHGLLYARLCKTFDPDTARLYWEANERALAQFRTLAGEIPCDFEPKDNYIYAASTPDQLEQELAALQQLRIPADFVERLPLPIATMGAIRFRNQAQFNPVKFLAGISQNLNIYEHTPARAFEGNAVITDHGRITASKIIVATHFPILNKHGAYFMKMYQQRSYVLALKNAGDVNGMYLDVAEHGLSFRNYGDLLLLGGGGHRTGKPGGGWAELQAFAKKHYPQAQEAARWAAQDCMSLDGIPYIGQYSKSTPNLYVATGFNKWGMTTSMVAAEILSELVQGRPHPWEPVFSPLRSMLRPQLAVNLWDSAVNLLTPTVPRCPHLGCALKWNPQERSWDCPCHGSRFTEAGTLLDNPATGNLKKKP